MQQEKVLERLEEAEASLAQIWKRIDRMALNNQEKVLRAFQEEEIGLHHFQTSTGYGYNDLSREALESLFARVFHGEAALVRQQFASGTHAITTC
ncbi:MAG TPA: methionine gamma-lyase family protein, partial [Bacillota bacterium]|nr:methionine gamma-lyase family protein [Bacillota bacterium]